MRQQKQNNAKCKVFTAYDHEWLQFIINNRNRKRLWKDFDYIEGGIADDRVITTIEDYVNGDISMDFTLRRLSEHQPNNQICITSQKIIEHGIRFIKAEPLNDIARKETKDHA